MLARGNAADARPLAGALRWRPRPPPEAFAADPATAADRWHARLLPVRPALRLGLAAMWIGSGLVSAFVAPLAHSHAPLAGLGLHGAAAAAVTLAGAALDVALGQALLLLPRRARLVGASQIAATLLFTVLATLARAGGLGRPVRPPAQEPRGAGGDAGADRHGGVPRWTTPNLLLRYAHVVSSTLLFGTGYAEPRFTARIWFHLAGGNSATGATCWRPALLTRMSSRPCRSSVVSIMLAIAAGSDMSALEWLVGTPKSMAMEASASAIWSGPPKPFRTIAAPAPVSARAMPLVDPVTNATRPVRDSGPVAACAGV
jgi:hypothetical protein